MNPIRILARSAVNALVAASLLAPAGALAGSHVIVQSSPEATGGAVEGALMLAQSGGCYAIGQSIAAQHGGTVARADAATRGGQQVCVIVVVIPAQDGQRGRRLEFVVPQG
jgi:hypothetical protein